MANGEDTRNHPNRQVHRSRWTANQNAGLADSENSHMEESYQGKDPAEIVENHGYSSSKYDD